MDAAVRSALEFYRDAWVPKTSKKQLGLTWHPKEELLDDCGQRALDALANVESTGKTILYDGTGSDAARNMAEKEGQQYPAATLQSLVTEYLAVIDAEPEKDIWDTWDGNPADGAEKTSSDFAWEAHGKRVSECLDRLRTALAA